MIQISHKEKLRITTSSNADIDYSAFVNGPTFGSLYGKINSATDTTLSPALPNDSYFPIVSLHINNVDAVTSNDITISKYVSNTEFIIYTATIDPGEKIIYTDSKWTVYDSVGGIKTSTTAAGDMVAAVYDPSGVTEQLAGLTASQTLTNKRVTPRWGFQESSATPTINTDLYDCFSITTLAVDITNMSTNLSGTPTNFQRLLIRIRDNGAPRAISWGTLFEAKGVALPTTTVASKTLTVGFIYDTVAAKWGCIASVNEV